MRCAVGCGHLQRGAQHGHGVDDVRADDDHPVNRGLVCQRGLEESANPEGERLTEPLVRRGETLEPADWDTALGVVAAEFIERLANDTGEIAVLGSGQQTNEAAYTLGKLARGGFGTQYYDANTTLCMASAVTGYFQAFGSDAPPPTYDDIPRAATHVIWGANPSTAHPVLYNWITESAEGNGGTQIVVDPIESETAAEADLHIRPDPGTDLALARAVLAQIVSEGSVDAEFVAANTEGYEAMVDSLPDVETAAGVANVPLEQVEQLATALDSPTLIYWGMGVNQSAQGTATVRSLIDLCLATGNMGPGSGPFSLTGQANSMGTRVCSSKGTWPGHREFTDPDHRATVAQCWGVPMSRLPEATGPGPVEMTDRMIRGDVTACWAVATNPVAGMSDARRVRMALDSTFLVVQDAFRSETVEYADVVLPAATWGESEGTVTNMERTVSRVRTVSEPPGSARRDLDIIAALGHRIDPDLFETPPVDPEAAFEEIRELTAGMPADLSGISYDRLDAEYAVRWPASDETDTGGYRYLDTEGEWSFPTDSGLARFSSATHSGVPEPATDEYPLVLTTGRRPDAYNTGVRTREAEDSLPTARLHPETVSGHLRAFHEGRTVVESRRGSATVTVEPDDAVPPGVVWMDIHNPAANELTLATVDPESDEPNFKQCAIRLTAPKQSSSVAEANPS